jgi:hypothetical protein
MVQALPALDRFLEICKASGISSAGAALPGRGSALRFSEPPRLALGPGSEVARKRPEI